MQICLRWEDNGKCLSSALFSLPNGEPLKVCVLHNRKAVDCVVLVSVSSGLRMAHSKSTLVQ